MKHKLARSYNIEPWNILLYFHFLLGMVIVAFNLSISVFIRNNNLFYIPNEYPLGFQYGIAYSLAIISVMVFVILYLKINKRYPILTILILAGGISNFVEQWVVFQNVADYINIGISYFNLADLQIYIGLIVLNINVWFKDLKFDKLALKTN